MRFGDGARGDIRDDGVKLCVGAFVGVVGVVGAEDGVLCLGAPKSDPKGDSFFGIAMRSSGFENVFE